MRIEAGIDLKAYLARISYVGERSPTIETLREIITHHTEAIAFENLNPLLRWPVRLDVRALEDKIVHGGRGGYCFEQNLLLSRALTALGYGVTGLAARVLWNRNTDELPSRQHMLLLVDIGQQPFIVDVGFGGMTLTGVLRLELDTEQPTPHEPFRLIRDRDDYIMQAQVRNEWRSLYQFDLQPQLLPDYEVSNWYVSTHPDSPFVTALIAARASANGRYTLRNADFAVHHLNGQTERQTLSSINEVRQKMQDLFRLRLPESPEVDVILERLLSQPV